jgi:hypothetical protein
VFEHIGHSVFRLLLALVAVLGIAILAAGCSTEQRMLGESGGLNGYLAEGQSYPFGPIYYSCFDDPFCLEPYSYPPADYGDGDYDCDDGFCGGRPRRPYPRPVPASPSELKKPATAGAPFIARPEFGGTGAVGRSFRLNGGSFGRGGLSSRR